MTSQKVSANLMVEHTKNSTTMILTWKSDVDFRFTSFRVVSHGCRSYLPGLEVYGQLICELQLINVLLKNELRLFL